MTKIITFLAGYFGLKTIKIAISVLYFAAVLAFYAFIINVIIVIHNLLNTFLNTVSGYGLFDTGALSAFFSMLNIIGFSQAVADSLPLITSALTFLLLKYLWRVTLDTYKELVHIALGVLGP